jgi:hypothetical protein
MIESPSEKPTTQNTNQESIKMQNNIVVKIDVTKIDKTRLYEGKKGVYLDAILMPNKEESRFGDDGFIIQSISKEAREAGERGPIVGNWRYLTAGGGNQQSNNDNAGGEKVPF